jgi:hypothetical protein
MGSEERETKPARIRGVERSLEVQIGSLGGFDLRPTRFFVWAGEERKGRERVVPLDSPPRNLRIPRRERRVEVGLVRARTLGNPLLTIALAGVYAAKKVSSERQRRELERSSHEKPPLP